MFYLAVDKWLPFLFGSNAYVILSNNNNEKKKRSAIKQINGIWMLHWHLKFLLISLFQSLLLSLIASCFRLSLLHFLCVFVLIYHSAYCRNLLLLLLLLLHFNFANSFPIYFQLITRIDTIVCVYYYGIAIAPESISNFTFTLTHKHTNRGRNTHN